VCHDIELFINDYRGALKISRLEHGSSEYLSAYVSPIYSDQFYVMTVILPYCKELCPQFSNGYM
jgi:hypothetical protein